MATVRIGLSEVTPLARWRVIGNVFKIRLKIVSRYKGWLLMDIFMPLVLAALPILLGTAFAGSARLAEENFMRNVHTPNYKLYLLIGAAMMFIVSLSMWLVGFWVRREMETGTFESLYLAPIDRVWVLAGVSVYSIFRGVLGFTLTLILGMFVFSVSAPPGAIVVAMLFVVAGMLPLWGLSFMFGAVVMKVKEANALINTFQWVVAMLMGVFYPITFFPWYLQVVAISFPPTWVTQGVRASLLDISFFLQAWYMDLLVVGVFCVVFPLLGYFTYASVEQRLKRNEGVGMY